MSSGFVLGGKAATRRPEARSQTDVGMPRPPTRANGWPSGAVTDCSDRFAFRSQSRRRHRDATGTVCSSAAVDMSHRCSMPSALSSTMTVRFPGSWAVLMAISGASPTA